MRVTRESLVSHSRVKIIPYAQRANAYLRVRSKHRDNCTVNTEIIKTGSCNLSVVYTKMWCIELCYKEVVSV